jgi:PadR family transcriptional regulator AphA
MAAVEIRMPTTTEAAVLALLAIEGERSGYDLAKLVSKAIGHVWAPARSQLYAVLPRLVRDGLAKSRHVPQTGKPDKELHRVTARGRRALDAWLASVEEGSVDTFFLKLFVGGLAEDDELLAAHVEQYRRDVAARLAILREIEPTNTGAGHDRYHRFLLELGIGRAEHDLRWADRVLRSLRAG